MSGAEVEIIKILGPVAGTVFIVVFALIKSGFLARDDPSRNDVLNEIKAASKKVDNLDRLITDKVARLETRQAEHERRLNRLE